jgi:hypothetical protein
MRGTVCISLFFTRTQYRVFILQCEYPTSPFSLHIYKGNERMGIRNKEKGNKGNWKQREWGEGVSVWHMHRAKSVESVGSVVLHILHAGIFLLDANMKSVLPFCSLVTIQSMWVPTWSALLQVTSLPTSISYSICLHSATCNWLRKRWRRQW